ncbi:hypothetical protein DPEC_G00109470 [Dallia pectoralis]|uniref:Uncharacterized protein n=1 Tax=Dallia pectoralis TaxID=75939 RepID=A0ACC2GSN1_DALPE|nr:hypothetical protein DPEC_G00109470 [Dallia pectoralis]
MPDFCAAYGCSNRLSLKTRAHGITFHRVVEHNSPERQEEQYSHQERAAKMDSFTSLRLTPPTYQAQWDAVPQWDNPSHHHGGYGPEMQLAHSRQRGRGGASTTRRSEKPRLIGNTGRSRQIIKQS